MRLQRLVIIYGLALAAILWCRTAAQADSDITIGPAGSGGFAVSGNLTDRVATMELTVEYDVGTLGNPSASCGSLAGGAQCDINTGTAGIVRITITSAAPISGSGVLAGLNFTLLGDDPGAINSLDARMIDSNGNLITTRVKVVNPVPGQTGRPLPKLVTEKGRDSSPSEPSVPSAAGGEAQPETSASMVEERPARVKALLAATALPYQRLESVLESVLERFRGRPGEASLDSLLPLFEGASRRGIRQVPPIVLSDGRSTVRLVVECAGSSAAAMKFLLRGAHFIALRSEAANTWNIEILPIKGVYEASLTIMTESSLTEYPLTVSPQLDPAGGELGPDDFVRRRKLRTGPGTTTDKDAEMPAYVGDYIYAANYLVSRAVSGGK